MLTPNTQRQRGPHRLRQVACACALLLGALPATQAAPLISPSLKKMLTGLPIAEIQGPLNGMVDALEKSPCGGGLTGCYATQSGPLQLYFYTSGTAQQTLLLVVDKQIPLPKLLGEKVQKVMGGTALSSPIFSISTTDFALTQVRMPPALLKVVQDNYFNVNTLAFSSGVQMAARTNLGDPIQQALAAMGVNAGQMTMRAGVVMPIPADMMGAFGAAADAAHANTLAQAGADAAKPEAFIEFQFAPNASLGFGMPQMTLTDATFFLNNELTFGYKGNAAYKGAESKKVITQFQTPLDPAGAMDLLDFSFRMATPASFTMEDAAHVMVAMATRDPRLVKYGGGYIRNIESFKDPLLAMTKPLSVVQLNNPQPPPEYRFGDSSKPFPNDDKYFNLAVLGPLASGGPLLNAAGNVTILGQKMGWLAATAGLSGLHGDVGAAVLLKLGPLGKVNFKLQGTLAISADKQDVSLLGDFAGQKVAVGLSGSTMNVEVSASCVNPFEIKVQETITPTTNLANVLDGQGGVNVDPARLSSCIGKDLEAAYHKIAGEFSHLGGYSASAANAELKKIANAAAADYNQAKQAARQAATASLNSATSAWSGGTKALTGAVSSATGGHTAKLPDMSHARFDPSVFDWDYYYDAHPDLVRNKVDLVAHWNTTGYPSGWRGSREFDPQFYSKTYPDAVRFGSAPDLVLLNWFSTGIKEGRKASADFDVKSYLARYPDLQRAFGAAGYEAALVHWLTNGKAEKRDGRP